MVFYSEFCFSKCMSYIPFEPPASGTERGCCPTFLNEGSLTDIK